MGGIDDDLIDNRDYPWVLTLDEMILKCIDHLEAARVATNVISLHTNLNQASSALKAALNVYGMRLKKEKTE